MRGDVVLFKASADIGDKVISIATQGPFVHAEIDMGDGTFVGALYKGVDRHGQQIGDGVVHIPVKSLGAKDEDIASGLEWVAGQVGDNYGWTDIFSDGLRFFGVPVSLSLAKTYDCSDLATRYLIICRMAGPLGGLALHPETVSPNDLARAYHII